jgi:hypothetical protein
MSLHTFSIIKQNVQNKVKIYFDWLLMIVRLDEDDDSSDLELVTQRLTDVVDAEEDGCCLIDVDVQLFQLLRKLK